MGVAMMVNLTEGEETPARISVESLSWTDYDGVAAGHELCVGDLATFRYIDADSYDSEGWEIFFGPVISIMLDSVDEYASIEVLCQDGHLRRFANYEIHWESMEEYEVRLREGHAFNLYEE